MSAQRSELNCDPVERVTSCQHVLERSVHFLAEQPAAVGVSAQRRISRPDYEVGTVAYEELDSVVENYADQRTVNVHLAALVIKEAQFPEAVHKETDA